MGLTEWLRNKITALSIALSNVEKNTFSQTKDSFNQDTHHTQRHQQGTLADALVRGEINQEVKNLRWRTYKILKNTNGLSLSFDKKDAEGNEWYKLKKIEQSRLLKKITIDEHDKYPLELVVLNDETKLSDINSITEHFKGYDEPIKNKNEKGEVLSATHGEISSNEFFIGNKGEKQIQIGRTQFPKFYIERYAKKMNVRKISKTERLLEFYISIYPNDYDRTNNQFIKEIKKLINNESSRVNFSEIRTVEFISENTLGCEDYLYYNYEIKSFDKIVEFDGHYIIKFIATVINNGEDILSKYVENELEEKYLNKERKT